MAKIFLFPGVSYGLIGGSVTPEKMVLGSEHNVVVRKRLPSGEELASFDLFIVNVDPTGGMDPEFPGVDFLYAHGPQLAAMGKPILATTEALDFFDESLKELNGVGVTHCVALAVRQMGRNELPQVYLANDLKKAVADCLEGPARNDPKATTQDAPKTPQV